ncbi:MAG: SIS domain-containing protein [Clostridium sp.]
MTIFNYSTEEMKNSSSVFTLSEIHQQPNTWIKTLNQIKDIKSDLESFINNVINEDDFDIILTGAGTSEFIGNSLYSHLNTKFNHKVKSYGTTDIVSTPENYLSREKKTLLISFGRSGNSPESIGCVNVASAVCKNLYNLFITCNKDGALSKMANDLENSYAINLTDETHDQSFAMTSSFSNMYLAAYLTFNLNSLEEKEILINEVSKKTESFLNNDFNLPKTIVEDFDFDRIVYLGSNTLKGISQESSLKMLELTAGDVTTMFDTPLGFRHGPKSIINDKTLTVIYTSSDSYTYKYDLDLIKELSLERKGNKLLVVSNTPSRELESLADYTYFYKINNSPNNVELGLAYITFAQTLSTFKSLAMGITPDNPCPSGEVNRVVKGVTLYDYL